MKTGKELNDVKMGNLLKQQKETLEVLLGAVDKQFSELKCYLRIRSIIERYDMIANDFILADTQNELLSIIEELDSLKRDIVEQTDHIQKDIRAMTVVKESLDILSQSIRPIETMILALQNDWSETQPAFYTDAEQTDHIN